MTRWALPIIVAGALFLTFAAAAAASEPTLSVPSGPTPALYHPHHKPFKKMTLAELERHQAGALARYRYVSRFYLRWFKSNHRRLLSSAMAHLVAPVCKATGIRTPENYCWYADAARWTEVQVGRTRARIAAAAEARRLAALQRSMGGGAEFGCIHRHEGAWGSNTGNGYYGGLQMDMGFQGTYGPEFMARWGTADNWPVWAQVTAARRARDGYAGFAARGYGPWPNTARACGLM